MTCNKVGYGTRKEALDDVRAIEIQHKFRSKIAARKQKTNRKLRTYLCPRCGAWHLTSLKPTKNN